MVTGGPCYASIVYNEFLTNSAESPTVAAGSVQFLGDYRSRHDALDGTCRASGNTGRQTRRSANLRQGTKVFCVIKVQQTDVQMM